jgi:predicted RNA binding protein YcfA (HicA-like mRNA interferase family)
MTTRQRLLFFLTAWLIVLMPFLFWWNTWFGRSLSDKQLDSYLHDDKKPRHIQHALVQIGERLARGDRNLARWSPDLVRLSTYPVEEVRSTDAWVMGQDNAVASFHDALLNMLNDPSLTVRGNAALSLVRFGDASGRPQIVSLLQPAQVVAPQTGTISDVANSGAAVHANGLLAKLQSGGSHTEIRSPISGRIRSVSVHTGEQVGSGTVIATVDPDTEQVWEALRGLYVVGTEEDLPAVISYERALPDIPERVRQQAVQTEKAIRERHK